MTRLFVTATGTGIGKTFVTAALAHQLRARGQSVRALKPLISGFDPAGPSDTHALLAAQGLGPTEFDAISPWRFRAPLAPHMAAAREGRAVSFDDLVAFCRTELARQTDHVLVEGVGGAFVPLDDNRLVTDWIAALGLPSLLVTGSYLGSLSHCLSTVEAMRARGLEIAAILVSQSVDQPVPMEETVATLARFLPGIPLVPVPRVGDGATPAWQRAADLPGPLAL